MGVDKFNVFVLEDNINIVVKWLKKPYSYSFKPFRAALLLVGLLGLGAPGLDVIYLWPTI